MKLKITISVSAVLVLVLAVLACHPAADDNKTTDASKTEAPSTPPQQPVEKTEVNTPDRLPDGVNPIFKDKPATQVMWMERGRNILLNNNPHAESADFRNTYFHRSFNGRPVTCGEVQLSNSGTVISDFQRFIYLGLQSSYLEHDVTNFDILWSKMCIQTLD